MRTTTQPKEAREITFDIAEKQDLWAGMFSDKVTAPKFRTEYNLRGKKHDSDDRELVERRNNGFNNL